MKSSLKKSPKIAILMCTYNGAQYLKEQLDSIEAQDYRHWKLYVSDDGSKDKTLNILKNYQKRWGKDKLQILKGPNINFQSNFISLITHSKIHADIYFLSDQDDIWMPIKLTHTLKYLRLFDITRPLLYCARTTYISSNGKKTLGQSDLFIKPPSFKNALVQSIAGGNTMAFNEPLKKIAQKYKHAKIVSHDWWLYILNELSKGQTFYDQTSTIWYRQHKKSLIGANTGFIAKLKRIKLLLLGVYRRYNTIHFEAFNLVNMQSTKENLDLIDHFFILRNRPLRERIKLINTLGIYRQTWDGQIGLYLGAILKKL